MFLKELGCILFVLMIELVVYMALGIVAVLTIALGHPHFLYKSEKLNMGEGFCKPIGDHLFGRDIQKLDSFYSYLISNILVLDVNVLCSQIKNRFMS